MIETPAFGWHLRTPLDTQKACVLYWGHGQYYDFRAPKKATAPSSYKEGHGSIAVFASDEWRANLCVAGRSEPTDRDLHSLGTMVRGEV